MGFPVVPKGAEEEIEFKRDNSILFYMLLLLLTYAIYQILVLYGV
jgi:hypothetical protein